MSPLLQRCCLCTLVLCLSASCDLSGERTPVHSSSGQLKPDSARSTTGAVLLRVTDPPQSPPTALLKSDADSDRPLEARPFVGRWLHGHKMVRFGSVRHPRWPRRQSLTDIAQLVLVSQVPPETLLIQIFQGGRGRSRMPKGPPLLTLDCWGRKFDVRGPCHLTQNGHYVRLKFPEVTEATDAVDITVYAAWTETRAPGSKLETAWATWLFAAKLA